jgi:hypothetical protein
MVAHHLLIAGWRSIANFRPSLALTSQQSVLLCELLLMVFAEAKRLAKPAETEFLKQRIASKQGQ